VQNKFVFSSNGPRTAGGADCVNLESLVTAIDISDELIGEAHNYGILGLIPLGAPPYKSHPVLMSIIIET
jgi:hypothetical protein